MSTFRERLRAAAPGQRWVVRVRLPDGSATDVVGWVVEAGPDAVSLAGPLAPGATPEPDQVLPYAAVLAARRAPAAAGGPDPRRTSADELEQLAVPAWAAELEPLGEWTLRSGGGFSGRANSCLAVGDPGLPLDRAAARVVSHAEAHGIAPMAQVVTGSALDEALRQLGWVQTYVATDVLTVRLADLLARRDPSPDVVVEETLTPRWRAAYDESRPSDADPAWVTAVLAGRPPRAFASVEREAVVAALGRGHLGGDWLGLGGLWTRPSHRRQGLAADLVVGLGHWAARRGARYCYLQVATENVAAHSAYARLGFSWHHRYHYLAPPTPAATATAPS